MKPITLTSIDGERQIKQHIFIEDEKGAISLCKKIRPSNDGEGVASLNSLSNLFETLDRDKCCKHCLKIYDNRKALEDEYHLRTPIDVLISNSESNTSVEDFFKEYVAIRPNLKTSFHDAGIEVMAFAEAYCKYNKSQKQIIL